MLHIASLVVWYLTLRGFVKMAWIWVSSHWLRLESSHSVKNVTRVKSSNHLSQGVSSRVRVTKNRDSSHTIVDNDLKLLDIENQRLVITVHYVAIRLGLVVLLNHTCQITSQVTRCLIISWIRVIFNFVEAYQFRSRFGRALTESQKLTSRFQSLVRKLESMSIRTEINLRRWIRS